MKRLLLAATVSACVLLLHSPSNAQAPVATVVTSCNTATGWLRGQSQPLTVDTNGNLCSAASGSAGNATAANQTAVQGTVAAGTAATSSELIGGVYNTSLPTLTNGQQAATQVDSNARQITVGAGVAGTPAGGVTSVQGVTNGTPLPTTGTDGTNIGNYLAAASASNALSAQGAAIVAGADKEVAFTTTSVQAVGTTDVSNYRLVSVQITAQGGSSTVTFQGSNDNSNWFSVSLIQVNATVNNNATVSATTTNIFTGPITYRYFRLNVTGIISGTTSGTIEFYTVPAGPISIAAAANTAFVGGVATVTAASGVQKVGIVGNTGAAMDAAGQNVASPANELLTGCQFNTTPTTITTGNMSPDQCDANGYRLAANVVIPTSSASYAITPTVSGAAEASHVLKASAGNVYSASGTNATATGGFLILINATSAPTTGSAITPLACVPLPANGVASINYNPGPVARFSTGITALLSSNASCFTFTSGTITGFISGLVQ